LILLSKIDELELLAKISLEIYITPVIKAEFGKLLPPTVKVKSIKDNHYQKILEMDLDAGEASAIALSLETENSLLIIDDLKARKIAERLNLRYSGTLGLILKAKQTGAIENVSKIFEKIRETNFRFSNELINTILKEAGE
jgi:predicted nucleic acid-binding protein